MNFTESQYEKLMKEKPFVPRNERHTGNADGKQRDKKTSGQLDPEPA